MKDPIKNCHLKLVSCRKTFRFESRVRSDLFIVEQHIILWHNICNHYSAKLINFKFPNLQVSFKTRTSSNQLLIQSQGAWGYFMNVSPDTNPVAVKCIQPTIAPESFIILQRAPSNLKVVLQNNPLRSSFTSPSPSSLSRPPRPTNSLPRDREWEYKQHDRPDFPPHSSAEPLRPPFKYLMDIKASAKPSAGFIFMRKRCTLKRDIRSGAEHSGYAAGCAPDQGRRLLQGYLGARSRSRRR